MSIRNTVTTTGMGTTPKGDTGSTGSIVDTMSMVSSDDGKCQLLFGDGI